jgi:hypothetical protein
MKGEEWATERRRAVVVIIVAQSNEQHEQGGTSRLCIRGLATPPVFGRSDERIGLRLLHTS